MKAREFDKWFDEGEDVSKYLDMTKARRLGQEQKRVNVDFPLWMVRLLDKEAKRGQWPDARLVVSTDRHRHDRCLLRGTNLQRLLVAEQSLFGLDTAGGGEAA